LWKKVKNYGDCTSGDQQKEEKNNVNHYLQSWDIAVADINGAQLVSAPSQLVRKGDGGFTVKRRKNK
jgi:hypothetical protein